MSSIENSVAVEPKSHNPWKTFGITIIVLAILALCIWAVKAYFFPNELKPVQLSSRETQQLNKKLGQLNLPGINTSKASADPGSEKKPLKPEPYSEVGANREVRFSEREVNALIAHNTDMADKLAIDLSDNLASAKLILPLDPDLPLFGGKTLNISAGIEFAFGGGKPVVKLRGVSAWGVPVPNAWLNDLKNVDLVNEFGSSGGFWQAFADGIDYMNVSDGELIVKLKE